jgi:polyhydroxybutyrate depolymerase
MLLLVALTAASQGAEPRHGEFPAEGLTVGRTRREYRLYVPESVDLRTPAPLVVAFHGMLIDSKDVMPKYTRLNATAEKHQFLIAYPNALEGSWGIKPEKITNDLAFFDALLKRLGERYTLDERRLYVLGMSNGGYFAHLVGKERSGQVAAVASHSGPLGLQTLLGIQAERKFSVLIVHGKDDRLFPVRIARENRDKYRREGHTVQLVEIPDLGHFWGQKAGVNETIWEFFAKHPLPKK